MRLTPLFLPLLATALAAQTPTIRIAGRVQAHFSTSAGDSSAAYDPGAVVASAFEIRRLRIEAEARLGERVMLRIVPSLEMARLRMRDAFLRVRVSDGVGVTMGQEKKPLDRYALTSSNNLPSIERGARIRGIASPVSHSNLLEDNGYAEHDIGASVDLSLWGARASLKAGVYNGTGESAAEVNGAKTFGARLTAALIGDASRPVLRVGAAAVSRDRAVTTTATSTSFAPDSARRTAAFALDLELGDFRPGLHLIADAATGRALRAGNHCLDGAAPISCRVDNGLHLGALRPGAPDSAFGTFVTLQVVVAWRWRLDTAKTRLVTMIEPALRLDYTDPSRAHSADHAILGTPVLNVYFSDTTVLRAGVDVYTYHDVNGRRASARALRVSWQAHF